MTEQQTELLAEIQRLVLTGPGQTGYAMNHSYTIHSSGMVSSSIQVMSIDFRDSEHVTRATANQAACDDSMSLAEQHDALVSWIAANRKERAA